MRQWFHLHFTEGTGGQLVGMVPLKSGCRVWCQGDTLAELAEGAQASIVDLDADGDNPEPGVGEPEDIANMQLALLPVGIPSEAA